MNKTTHLRTLVAASMMSVGALLLVGVLLYVTHPTPAQANSGDLNNAIAQYPSISNTRLNSCSLCHSSSIPSLNPYGAAYLAQGRTSAALKAIEALDSDGDGFTNIQEINALTFPGNANDKPAAAATATNTPTKAPTNTPTKAPTNIPTSAPTNTPTKVNTPTSVPPTSTPTRAAQPTNTPTVPVPSPTHATPAPTATQPAYPPPSTATQPAYPPPATATSVPTSQATPTSAPTSRPTSTSAPTRQPTPTRKPTSNPGSQTLAIGPSADAYVTASEAKHNFGGAKELKAVQDPAARSYLRFDVKGLDEMNVSKATLSLYVNSASGDGFDILRVSDSGWVEGKITYSNAPKTGSRIASSGASSGQWVTIDVTSFIQGNGRYTMALVAHKGSSISFASRETGSNAPQLKLTFAQRSGGDDGGNHDD